MPRTTDYKEEYDERIIYLAKQGMFLYEIAAELGYTYKCLHGWSKKHPSFGYAYERALTIIMSKMFRELFEMRKERHQNPRCVEFIIEQMLGQRQYSQVGVKGLGAKSIADKIHAVLESAESGELRPDQAKTLMEAVKVAQDTVYGQDAMVKMKEMLEKGKSKELLKLLKESC